MAIQALEHLRAHEAWRATTLNLIASENLISPAVRAALSNDLVGRYTDYNDRDLQSRRYRGNRYVAALEQEAEALAKEVFGASEVDLRPLSGHVAGVTVLLGICSPGDTILEVGSEGGSHRMGAKLAMPNAIMLNTEFLPFDEDRWNVDVPKALAMIAEKRPKVVILGSSAFLFPHPVREIAQAVKALPGSVLVYDGSHVLGLLAGGGFQKPLEEGADIIFGSTHKTFPGPQGGIILSNNADLMDRIAAAIYPPIVTNHHSFRIPALAVALDEMRRCGRDYVRQIVTNSRAMGAALASEGFPPLMVDDRYSDSHTLLVPVPHLAGKAAEQLERCGIIAGNFRVPKALGSSGIRIGTQELTRQGARAEAMTAAAKLIASALLEGDNFAEIACNVEQFVATLPGPSFV